MSRTLAKPAGASGAVRRLLVLLLCASGVVAQLVAADRAASFTTGFYDDGAYTSPERSFWLSRTVDARAGIVRINVSWASVAPTPPTTAPSDPTDPAYSGWAGVDAEVRDVAARGLQVLLTVGSAPSWAEGAGRASDAPPGTWRPDPGQLGAFAQALAARYSGSFLDPVTLTMLPAVHDFQAWNEPNLSTYLTPQWSGGGPASPYHYRAMLNEFYAGVKNAQPGAFVVSAGTAPYGDPVGGRRMTPVLFLRTLLCLSGQKLKPASCPNPVHLDAISHHPYGVGEPRRKALDIDNAAVPDLGKLTRVLRKAESSGRVLPAGHKRLWVTEFSWDSNPPDPDGVPAGKHARWAEEAMYLFWRQGVDTAIWLLIRDSAPVPSFASTYQSGIFLGNGAPKPAYHAFRFPFVTERLNKGRLRAWGKAPDTGVVNLQIRKKRRGWRTIKRLQGYAGGVFVAKLRVSGRAKLRAQMATATSVTWPQR